MSRWIIVIMVLCLASGANLSCSEDTDSEEIGDTDTTKESDSGTDEDTDTKQCADECTITDGTQCEGTIIQECARGTDGCLTWLDRKDCSDDNQSCEKPSDAAICVCPGDLDCDGVLTEEDCDDNDATLTARSDDQDCDGASTADDCDDNDVTLLARVNDQDCDRVLMDDDCDDNDATMGALAMDEDCDGFTKASDCDDLDPTVTTVSGDADCNGIQDLVFFEKVDYADPTVSGNQDCFTAGVCLTRADNRGLFNAVNESIFSYFTTPSDLEFALGYVGQSLSYDVWMNAVDDKTKSIFENLAMHAISDDVYFNTMFYKWSQKDSGGGFAYARANAVSFTKEDYADWTELQFQDCLAPGVCLTRQDGQSLFNISKEDSASETSPADTEWAMGATSEVTSSSYSSFTAAVDSDPQTAVDQLMSLHVLSLDIYYDVIITSYSGGDSGGGFSYVRSRAIVKGCTDPTKSNYNSLANIDDGLCLD